jgi:IclR family transcriptional regulator, acetate operon repressor
MQNESDRYQIRSVERVLDMITIIAEADNPLTFSEIVEMTGLPKSSTFRYLNTLVSRGYFDVDEVNNTYQIGPGFPARNDEFTETVKEFATPLMVELHKKWDETVNLGVLAGLTIKYLKVIESTKLIRASSRIGARDPLYCTGLGKVILSKFDNKEIKSILQMVDFTPKTKKTVSSATELQKQINQIRERGFALDDQENDPDCRCVAVSVPLVDYNIAISLSAPSSRLPLVEVKEVAKDLSKVAKELVEMLKIRGETSKTERRK